MDSKITIPPAGKPREDASHRQAAAPRRRPCRWPSRPSAHPSRPCLSPSGPFAADSSHLQQKPCVHGLRCRPGDDGSTGSGGRGSGGRAWRSWLLRPMAVGSTFAGAGIAEQVPKACLRATPCLAVRDTTAAEPCRCAPRTATGRGHCGELQGNAARSGNYAGVCTPSCCQCSEVTKETNGRVQMLPLLPARGIQAC